MVETCEAAALKLRVKRVEPKFIGKIFVNEGAGYYHRKINVSRNYFNLPYNSPEYFLIHLFQVSAIIPPRVLLSKSTTAEKVFQYLHKPEDASLACWRFLQHN